MSLLPFCRRGGYTVAAVLLLAVLMPSPTTMSQPVAPVSPPADQQVGDAHRQRMEELRAQRDAISRSSEQLAAEAEAFRQRLQGGRSLEPDAELVRRAEVGRDATRVRLREQELQADNVERNIQERIQRIRSLETQRQLMDLRVPGEGDGLGPRSALDDLDEQLRQQREELEAERYLLGNLQRQAKVTRERLRFSEAWADLVNRRYREIEEISRRQRQEDLESALQRQAREWLDRADSLRDRLERQRSRLTPVEVSALRVRIAGAEEEAAMLQAELLSTKRSAALKEMELLLGRSELKAQEMQRALLRVAAIRTEAADVLLVLEDKLEVYSNELKVLEESQPDSAAQRLSITQTYDLVQGLMVDLKAQRNEVDRQLEQTDELQRRIDAKLRDALEAGLFRRDHLPQGLQAWQLIGQGLRGAPRVLLGQLRISLVDFWQGFLERGPLVWVLSGLAGLVLIRLGSWGRRNLGRYVATVMARGPLGFLGNSALVALLLLRKNLIGILLVAAIALLLAVARPSNESLGILLVLGTLWLPVKLLVDLAYQLFNSASLPAEERRPALCMQFKYACISVGTALGLVILANLAGYSADIRDLVTRLFCLLLLTLISPALRLRNFLLLRLRKDYGERFAFRLMSMLSLVVPVTLFTISILGLIGYKELAGLIGWHLGLLLAVLLGWVVARELLSDLSVFLKNLAVKHAEHALLWTQDVISPLHRLASILLFVLAILVFLNTAGLSGYAKLTDRMGALFQAPLFHIGKSPITLGSISAAVIVFLIVLSLGQWIRAVAYRWLYGGIADRGARHSMSVFTQYAVVLIGFFVTLQILGLDLTTLTVFAGALGVGIGFGMQTIANNFISGLLLLAERPLRTGDWVQIGPNEGKVSSIGMRSLTVTTWDNQEVIIPNADVISNAFTNWTHHDNIVRTVLYVRVSYEADPHKVKEIFSRVLSSDEGILADPEPAVLLWDYPESAVLFRVQYFCDTERHGMLGTRDRVLFRIWDALKEAGIRIPYPQRDVHLWPADTSLPPPADPPPGDRLSGLPEG